MSGDIRTQRHPEPELDCLDRHDGRELLLAEDFATVLTLPGLLEPELDESREVAEAELRENLSTLAHNVRINSARVHDLTVRDDWYFKMQTSIRSDVVGDLDYLDGRFPAAYIDIRRAIARLAPEETKYITQLVSSGREVTDEDYIHAGQLDRSSRMAKLRGNAPRMEADTEENLEALYQIIDANTHLTLLEGHRQSGAVLSLCLAFGNRRQVGTAVNLFQRLRGIACNEEWSVSRRVMEQDRVAEEVARLAHGLVSGNFAADPTTQQRARTRVASYMEDADMRLEMEGSLAHVLRGRMFRLYGKHPEPETAMEAEIEQPAEPAPVVKLEAPKPEPRPDHLGHYRGKLEAHVASADFKRFEELTTKEAKRRGLNEARAVLVKGESDGAGNLLIGGRSKVEAHRYVSAVEFLRSFITETENIVDAKDALEAAIEASNDYETQLQEVLAEASGVLTTRELSALKNDMPVIETLSEVVSYVRNDWDTASFVIVNYWPGGQGRAIAEQLRQLLFLDKEELEAAA